MNINVSVDKNVAARLEEIRRDTSAKDLSDVFRHALAIYDMIVSAKLDAKRVGVMLRDYKLTISGEVGTTREEPAAQSATTREALLAQLDTAAEAFGDRGEGPVLRAAAAMLRDDKRFRDLAMRFVAQVDEAKALMEECGVSRYAGRTVKDMVCELIVTLSGAGNG